MEKYMRRYRQDGSNDVAEVKCNMCGEKMRTKNGIITDGIFSVDYRWGYFSEHDGETHSFDLCEKCYEKLIKSFEVPVEVSDTNEML